MLTHRRSHEHCSYLCLATAALAALLLVCLAGCQTARAPATVAAPGTGMIGQPAQYGSWATPPQGAAYPPLSSPPPMPGPTAQWQAAAPASPPANSWSWSQPAMGAPQTPAQYGAQLQNQANQFQQNVTGQAQQFANQMQAQPQQYANQLQATANQYQQNAAAQWTQMNNQAQQQAQQYMNSAQQQAQQALTGAQQQAQQYLNAGQQQVQPYMNAAQQQVTSQMPTYPPAYQPQPAPNTSWNPFATPATSLPPARATPTTAVPRY